jgi:small subunit ribosomal protein S6
MAHYEHVLIARPEISPAEVDALVEDITKTISELGGRVGKTEYWGLRNLAYRIRKNRKGHYALINLDCPAPAVHELERRLRINEDVMRFKTVRVEALDEEPSPILARRDRDERRDARRNGHSNDDGALSLNEDNDARVPGLRSNIELISNGAAVVARFERQERLFVQTPNETASKPKDGPGNKSIRPVIVDGHAKSDAGPRALDAVNQSTLLTQPQDEARISWHLPASGLGGLMANAKDDIERAATLARSVVSCLEFKAPPAARLNEAKRAARALISLLGSPTVDVQTEVATHISYVTDRLDSAATARGMGLTDFTALAKWAGVDALVGARVHWIETGRTGFGLVFLADEWKNLAGGNLSFPGIPAGARIEGFVEYDEDDDPHCVVQHVWRANEHEYIGKFAIELGQAAIAPFPTIALYVNDRLVCRHTRRANSAARQPEPEHA